MFLKRAIRAWIVADAETKFFAVRVALMGAFFGVAFVGAIAFVFDLPQTLVADFAGGATGLAAGTAAFKYLTLA